MEFETTRVTPPDGRYFEIQLGACCVAFTENSAEVLQIHANYDFYKRRGVFTFRGSLVASLMELKRLSVDGPKLSLGGNSG